MTDAERKELIRTTAGILGSIKTPKKRASSRRNLAKANKRLAEVRKQRRREREQASAGG